MLDLGYSMHSCMTRSHRHLHSMSCSIQAINRVVEKMCLCADEAYLQHIAKETKSVVMLRGQGSGMMEQCASAGCQLFILAAEAVDDLAGHSVACVDARACTDTPDVRSTGPMHVSIASQDAKGLDDAKRCGAGLSNDAHFATLRTVFTSASADFWDA